MQLIGVWAGPARPHEETQQRPEEAAEATASKETSAKYFIKKRSLDMEAIMAAVAK